MLQKTPAKLSVIAVWEPVLKEDGPPDTSTLQRLTDGRVVQLWDPEHLISTAIGAGMKAHPGAIPFERQRTKKEGILWDAVAVYPPQARWEDTLPAPTFLDGDVDDVIQDLQEILRRF